MQLAVAKRSAIVSQAVRGLTPPQRETRMKPDQTITTMAAKM
jgi:hypothetical protein